MARLPTKEQLSGPLSTRSGRIIASQDTSGLGRGIANMGAHLRSAGNSLAKIADERKRDSNAIEGATAGGLFSRALNDLERGYDTRTDYDNMQEDYDANAKAIGAQYSKTIKDPKGQQQFSAWADRQILGGYSRVGDRADAIRKDQKLTTYKTSLEGLQQVIADDKAPQDVRDRAEVEALESIDEAISTGFLSEGDGKTWRDNVVNGGKFILGERILQANAGALDVNMPVENIIAASARRYGIDPSVLIAMGRIESSLDPSARNDVTTAGGLFQFTDGTARDYGLKNKFDAAESSDAAARKALDGIKKLRGVLGREPTPGEIYLSHFAGVTGGSKLAFADNNTPISEVLSAGQIRSNPSVLGGKTVGEVKAWASQKMAENMGATAPDVQFVDARNVKFIDDTKGKIRDKPITTSVRNGIAWAAASTDSRLSIKIISGGQPKKGEGGKRTGSERHDDGNSADIVLVLDGKEILPGENKELYARFFRNAAANGFTGLGHYAWGIHVGGGKRAAWGPDTTSDTIDPYFSAAIQDGWDNQGKAAKPDWYTSQSPENQLRLEKFAVTQGNKRSAEARAWVDTAMTNAPAAILNTGHYDQPLPGRDVFTKAFGEVEGGVQYDKFQQHMAVASTSFEFKTMSASQINTVVAAAKPTSSGNDAALEQAAYNALRESASQVLKLRAADPAAYVANAFGEVGDAWKVAGQDPTKMPAAIAASIAHQKTLGITDIMPMPKQIADTAVLTFEDKDAPQGDRINGILSLVMSTPDKEDRTAIFKQLVAAGLPPMTEGAFEAAARGDKTSARNLFQAAMIDPNKLPSFSAVKQSEIDHEIQGQIMDDGKVGDIYYGMTDPVAENLERAINDSQLINNAVGLKVMNGMSASEAVKAVAKDLYGDVRAINDTSWVNVSVLVSPDTDVGLMQHGFIAAMPQLESSMKEMWAAVNPTPADRASGNAAVILSAEGNRISSILNEGTWRNSGDGFVFVDPYTGAAVADADGNPLVFSIEDIAALGEKRRADNNNSLAPAPPINQWSPVPTGGLGYNPTFNAGSE